MSDSVSNEEVLTTHTYDGIEEYDNPMPGWWSFIFITNIVWAFVYMAGMALGMLPDYETDLRADMMIQRAAEERSKQALPPITPEMLAEGAAKPEVVAKGAEVFAMNCAVCHGNRGQGLIGPNLTDDAWLNGDGTIATVHHVIAVGTPKGMPPWASVLLQDDQVAVTGFVMSLLGTNPADAKAAEGTVYPRDGSDE